MTSNKIYVHMNSYVKSFVINPTMAKSTGKQYIVILWDVNPSVRN